MPRLLLVLVLLVGGVGVVRGGEPATEQELVVVAPAGDQVVEALTPSAGTQDLAAGVDPSAQEVATAVAATDGERRARLAGKIALGIGSAVVSLGVMTASLLLL
ncbi:MAG: hypothetical protein U0807_10120 [Candidatus Binatia bacterium]